MKYVGRKRNSTHTKWSNKDRYLIGKYAPENGVVAAVRKFKRKFQNLNESTVQSFQKKVEAELKKASKEKREPSKVIVKFLSPTGCPLMLGQLISMVQIYLIAQSRRGCVINTSIANVTARALIQGFPQTVGNIDLQSTAWTRSLFRWDS